MHILLALKAFWKALFCAEEAHTFLAGYPKEIEKEGDRSHLRLLALLQQRGRLIDFLQEEIEGFDDAQIGAAVREVHKNCRRCLEELVALRPIADEAEGAKMRLSKGYDACRFKVVGKIIGDPPYDVRVVHRGWLACKLSLPRFTAEGGGSVIAPAEVEVAG